MTRLYVLVEGQTEEQFVKRTLAPHLTPAGVQAIPVVVTTRRERTGLKHRGGGHWKHWQKDLHRLLGEQKGRCVRFTTLFDLYGLPDDFPGIKRHRKQADTRKRARSLEEEMRASVADSRFIPYVQRHEFEALVLASLDALHDLLEATEDLEGLERLRTSLAGLAPEDVNDRPDRAPSSRLEAHLPGYVKTLHGPDAIEYTGLPAVRSLCPRFHEWLQQLENLPAGGAP